MISSKRGYSLLVPALATALVLFVSGCQKYDQTEVRIADDGKSKTDPAGKPVGGYTPEEKTYFADILKLKSYETHLSATFKKLDAVAWSASINAKKWLFVPQELNADDSRNMAVHFLDGEDKALAIQTSNDVRVQKVLFETLNSEEQADFLLTEIMTSVYLYKNLNDTELCAVVRATNNTLPCPFLKNAAVENAEDIVEESNERSQDTAQAAFKSKKPNDPPKKTPVNDPRYGKKERLGATDYHRISLLVAYVKETGKDITHKKILTKMTELGFDTRIFQVTFPKVQGTQEVPEEYEPNGPVA
jgi:hypothetical protein